MYYNVYIVYIVYYCIYCIYCIFYFNLIFVLFNENIIRYMLYVVTH